jgi:hypothetical protein
MASYSPVNQNSNSQANHNFYKWLSIMLTGVFSIILVIVLVKPAKVIMTNTESPSVQGDMPHMLFPTTLMIHPTANTVQWSWTKPSMARIFVQIHRNEMNTDSLSMFPYGRLLMWGSPPPAFKLSILPLTMTERSLLHTSPPLNDSLPLYWLASTLETNVSQSPTVGINDNKGMINVATFGLDVEISPQVSSSQPPMDCEGRMYPMTFSFVHFDDGRNIHHLSSPTIVYITAKTPFVSLTTKFSNQDKVTSRGVLWENGVFQFAVEYIVQGLAPYDVDAWRRYVKLEHRPSPQGINCGSSLNSIANTPDTTQLFTNTYCSYQSTARRSLFDFQSGPDPRSAFSGSTFESLTMQSSQTPFYDNIIMPISFTMSMGSCIIRTVNTSTLTLQSTPRQTPNSGRLILSDIGAFTVGRTGTPRTTWPRLDASMPQPTLRPLFVYNWAQLPNTDQIKCSTYSTSRLRPQKPISWSLPDSNGILHKGQCTSKHQIAYTFTRNVLHPTDETCFSKAQPIAAGDNSMPLLPVADSSNIASVTGVQYTRLNSDNTIKCDVPVGDLWSNSRLIVPMQQSNESDVTDPCWASYQRAFSAVPNVKDTFTTGFNVDLDMFTQCTHLITQTSSPLMVRRYSFAFNDTSELDSGTCTLLQNTGSPPCTSCSSNRRKAICMYDPSIGTSVQGLLPTTSTLFKLGLINTPVDHKWLKRRDDYIVNDDFDATASWAQAHTKTSQTDWLDLQRLYISD